MEFLTRTSSIVGKHPASDGPFVTPRYVENLEACFFYHTMDLPGFGLQEGGWDLRGRLLDYVGNVDIQGKRVLDVGSASGFLSFEAERLGARDVVSFDLDSAERQTLLPFAESEYVRDYWSWCRRQTAAFKTWQNAYWLSHRLFRSRAKVFYGDIYDVPSDLGRFDVVIVGAVLEHLSDPLRALCSLARRVDDIMVINTDYVDDPGHIALFRGRANQPENSFTFWTYSIATYDEYMKIMGFHPLEHRKDAFAGTPSSKGAPRPMLNRVALVYRRDR